MKYIVNISLLFYFVNCFSQDSFQIEPKEFQKIHFVYEEKSNYYIDDRGVYADTLLFSFEFPKLKYIKVKSPINPNQTCGFINYERFIDKEDKRKLIGSIYHNTQIYEGIYDAKKNKTTIKVRRDRKDESFIKVKNYLNESLTGFQFDIKIDYEKSIVEWTFPSTSWRKKFDEVKCEIVFDDNKTSGYYIEKTPKFSMSNMIFLNKNLNNKITPEMLFTNNDFGIEKVETLFSTYRLKSVTYE